METRQTGQARPRSPQPPGAPRWVAMFHDPSAQSWRAAAESPDRVPVLYALGEMTQVTRARGEDVTVDLWGPKDGAWHRYDTSPAPVAASEAPEPPSSGGALAPTRLAERMEDRRHQVLMAGLSKAGLYDLTPDDVTAVRALVDGADETTLRRVAHWLTVAAGQPTAE
ncbi:hypothetical protein ACFY30_23455 [Streptomyces sp. NPDC000345]|uniref:hypothetical protein n=1 Tax=Streptomyces sp. NPDC000345 TaxID=3364537 RepID=UPI003680CE1D